MELVNKNRCVIIGAGQIDDVDIIRNNTYYDDFIIAADAGYVKSEQAKVMPDMIIGDFDSSQLPDNDIETIVLNPVKDCTDTEYSLNKAVELGFTEVLIIGGLGKRNDHSFANFALICGFKQKGINITAIDENHRIFAVMNEEQTIVNNNQFVSVFAFGGECSVTLDGFFYPLDNYRLSPFQAIGTSNEIVGETAKITVSDGTALIMEVSKNL